MKFLIVLLIFEDLSFTLHELENGTDLKSCLIAAEKEQKHFQNILEFGPGLIINEKLVTKEDIKVNCKVEKID